MGSIDITYRDRVEYILSHSKYEPLVIVSPEGWDSDSEETSRHEKYHGIFTSFSNHLKFVDDGADFINNVRDIYGVNAEIRLTRRERHPRTDNWFIAYEGVLDLSTWQQDGFDVKVKFNSSGLSTELKARESEKVEIERETSLNGDALDPLETIQIQLDGRRIFLNSTWKQQNSNSVELKTSSNDGNVRHQVVSVPLEIVKKSHEHAHSVLANYPHSKDVGNTASMFLADIDRERKFTIKTHLSFKYVPNKYRYVNSSEFKVAISKYANGTDYNIIERIPLIERTGNFSSEQFTKDFTVDITLSQGESLALEFYMKADFKNKLWNIQEYEITLQDIACSLSIEEDSFFESSKTKAVTADHLGDRLIQIITGRKDAFLNELPELNLKGYAHGHWIRGFDKQPASDDNKYKPFTTSFKDYINDLMVTENIGLGIEKIGIKEQIVIRDLKEFYVNYVTIRLPHVVSGVKRKSANKLYYSSIKVGYEKGWNNEEAMGLDEYNTQSTFPTVIVRIKNVLSKVSKYIYASYATEFIRRKPITEYNTEDHSNDKEIFAFDLKKVYNSFKERLWQDDFEKAPTGVYSPNTATNLRYSPANLIKKHGWGIASSLVKYQDGFLRFGSSEGNSSLKTTLKGQKEVAENGDIKNSELGVARFVNEEITFEHEVDFDVKEQIKGSTIINGKKVLNIYGLIEFTNEKGQVEHGFYKNLKPNGKGTWTILKANR